MTKIAIKTEQLSDNKLKVALYVTLSNFSKEYTFVEEFKRPLTKSICEWLAYNVLEKNLPTIEEDLKKNGIEPSSYFIISKETVLLPKSNNIRS